MSQQVAHSQPLLQTTDQFKQSEPEFSDDAFFRSPPLAPPKRNLPQKVVYFTRSASQFVASSSFQQRVDFVCYGIWLVFCGIALATCVRSFNSPIISTSMISRDLIDTPDGILLACTINQYVNISMCGFGAFASTALLPTFDMRTDIIPCSQDPRYIGRLPRSVASLTGLNECLTLNIHAMIQDGCLPRQVSGATSGGIFFSMQVVATNVSTDFEPEVFGYIVSAQQQHVAYGPQAAKGYFGNTLFRVVERKQFGANLFSSPLNLWDKSTEFRDFYRFGGRDFDTNCSRLLWSFAKDQLLSSTDFIIEQQTDDVSFGLLNFLGFVGGMNGVMRLISRIIVWTREWRLRKAKEEKDGPSASTELEVADP